MPLHTNVNIISMNCLQAEGALSPPRTGSVAQTLGTVPAEATRQTPVCPKICPAVPGHPAVNHRSRPQRRQSSPRAGDLFSAQKGFIRT